MSINRKVSRAEPPYGAAQRRSSHRLFHRMLARQGVDPRRTRMPGIETLLIRALDNCAHCPAKQICRAWLSGHDAPASYVRFCPNAESIETLRIAGP